MGCKAAYVEKIETRCYENLLRLRAELERRGRAAGCNLDFAVRTFGRNREVCPEGEDDPERLFLSLLKDLVNLVCLEDDGDIRLVLLDLFNGYLEYLDKADEV